MSGTDQKALNLLAKGAGITAIALFGSKILTYIFKVVVARFLGPDLYGQYSLSLMVMGIATTLSMLSINSGIKKFIPVYKQKSSFEKIKGTLLSSVYISVPVSILAGLIMFFGADFIAIEIFDNSKLITLIKIMSIGPVFSNLTRIFFDTTKAYNIIIYDAIILKIFQSIVKISITVVLILLGFNVIGAAWGEILSTITVALIGFYILEKKIGPILFSDVKPEFETRKLLKYSFPLLFSGILGTVNGWADTALLGYFTTDTQVGFYNVALPTAMLILLPHQAIGSLSVTTLSELKERNKKAVESSLQTATYWVYSLVFPTFLILIFFSEQVLKTLWGSQYTVAALATSILAVGYLINALVGRVGSYLKSEGYTRYFLYNNILTVSFNIIINIILIPIYGIMGAAVATASSAILSNVLMFGEVWRTERIISVPVRKLVKVSIVGLIPLLFVMVIDNLLFTDTPFWFIFPAGALYYLMYILIFLQALGLEDEEKNVLLRVGEKTGYKTEIKRLLEAIS